MQKYFVKEVLQPIFIYIDYFFLAICPVKNRQVQFTLT